MTEPGPASNILRSVNFRLQGPCGMIQVYFIGLLRALFAI